MFPLIVESWRRRLTRTPGMDVVSQAGYVGPGRVGNTELTVGGCGRRATGGSAMLASIRILPPAT